MIALVQRVSGASVTVDDKIVSCIGRGFLVFVGIFADDTTADMIKLAGKICGLRVFEDDAGKMNLALGDIGGEVMLVSQFTLCAQTARGNRPSFIDAMAADAANKFFDELAAHLRERGQKVSTGVFGAHMEVSLVNDGPVTIILNTRSG